MQEDIGLQSTDGEFRRENFHFDFLDKVGGADFRRMMPEGAEGESADPEKAHSSHSSPKNCRDPRGSRLTPRWFRASHTDHEDHRSLPDDDPFRGAATPSTGMPILIWISMERAKRPAKAGRGSRRDTCHLCRTHQQTTKAALT